jgi:hypothetical protein
VAAVLALAAALAVAPAPQQSLDAVRHVVVRLVGLLQERVALGLEALPCMRLVDSHGSENGTRTAQSSHQRPARSAAPAATRAARASA